MRKISALNWTLPIAAIVLSIFFAAGVASEASAQEAPADEAADEDPFEAPADATPDELVEFAETLMRKRPQGETRAERMEYVKKMLKTISKTADRLEKIAKGQRHKLTAIQYKMMSLERLANLGDEEAGRQLEKLVANAKQSDDEGLASMGWQLYWGSKLELWDEFQKPQKEAVLQEFLTDIKQRSPRTYHVAIASGLAEELADYDHEFAKSLLNATTPLFRDASDADVAGAAQRLEGLTRRLNLPGNEIEISGTLLGGGEVDWESYRGKVVLVDFWATWCGPCRAEVPNILRMYRAYHEKGFHVLGVSLDKTPEQAYQYIEDHRIPWPSLFADDEAQRGWNHPLVDYYGIGGIPTAILVDADGRVVHMNARGRYLREQLQKLLGDPIDVKQSNEKSADREAVEVES